MKVVKIFILFIILLQTSALKSQCSVSINTTVSACYYIDGQSYATISAEVSWINAPSGNITVTGPAGSVPATRTIDPGTISLIYQGPPGTREYDGDQVIVSPQVVAFRVPANGATNRTVTASFDNQTSCNVTSTPFNIPAACPPTTCSTGQLGGTAYIDNDADGVKDAGETAGVNGITVRAISCNNTVQTTTTDEFGRYRFAAAITYPARIEFTTIPSFLGEGTINGTGSRTTTRFVTAASCSVNLGLVNQSAFCQDVPRVVTPCYVNGNPLVSGQSANGDALVAFNYGETGPKDPSKLTMLATASQVGTLWGVAYNKHTNRLYTSATIKRHAGLGPLGLGGIYVTNMATNVTSNYVDVAAAPLNINVGTIASNTARGLGSSLSSNSVDNQGFTSIGKVGIGDIEVSENGDVLYFTNLFDKRLYALNITGTNPTLIGSYPIPGTCSGGNLRPFGLKVFEGNVYVGSVCDASTSNKSNLRASVTRLNPTTLAFTEVMNFPLTYPKGPPFLNTAQPATNSVTGWFPWTDDWDLLNTNSFSTNTNSFRVIYPQPILSDIEFDVDGSMIMTFADRTGLQTGFQAFNPNGDDGELYTGFSGGDILRAAFTGTSYILENNATVPGVTGASPNNNQGPGFGEFYNDDFLSTDNNLNHSELAFGAAALKPGSGFVLVTGMDPIDREAGGTLNSGGIKYLNNETGIAPAGADAGFIVYNTDLDAGTFAKTTGLGDLELTCGLLTFLEVGNYVWIDTDGDGVQDACEPPLAGVNVDLRNASGTVIASTTTNTNGEYYFRTTNSLAPNTNYSIVFGRNQFSANRLTISGNDYSLTTANAATNTGNDQNDSDATIVSNLPTVAFMTNDFGVVNHKIDAGFILNLVCTASVTATPTPCNTTTNQYSISGQVTFTNPPATGTLTVSITGGSSQVFNAPFTSPVNYTINGQISDGMMKTVTATFSDGSPCSGTVTYNAPPSCVTPGTCDCKEYIYLNEPLIGSVLKFEVSSGVLLTEVLGANGGTLGTHHWYPGLNTSQLPSPHGLGTDLNGKLYIAAKTTPGVDGLIRRFDCDGRIEDSTSYKIPILQKDVFNMFSIGNILYATKDGGIDAFNTCTGQKIGEVCLNRANGTSSQLSPTAHWGLSYNVETQMVYVTRSIESLGIEIWAFSKAELDAAILPGGPCINPLISANNTANINVGDNFFPTGGIFDQIRGIVGDDSGNIYVVALDRANTLEGRIFKYDSQGRFIAMSSPTVFPIGIAWSRTYNRLYTTQYVDRVDVDCISVWNTNLDYMGTAAPNPGLGVNNSAKALAIIKECCPKNLPSTFQREVCGAIGTKFFLNQEAFNLCDGIVCGSSWTPTDNNNSIMTFDACDNSVVVNGNGCRTFTLSIGAVSSTSCGSQNSTFTICNTVINANVNTIVGTCAATGPNNNASIVINNILNVNQAGISVGTVYNGPAYGAAGTISITGGGTFPNLVHNTYYTVRIFNGSNDCFFDRVILIPELLCCSSSVTATPTACNTTTNQYSVSGQVTFTNPPATGTLTVSITGGSSQVFNAPFASPINYTINGQVSDGVMRTVTATFSADNTCTSTTTFTAPPSCVTPGTCDCKEYIYLNEPGLNAVLKFEVGSPIALTEVIGANGGTPPNQHWYPGLGNSEIPGPHGLGTDLNGRLYIGATGANDFIRQLDCDGNLTPLNGGTIFNPGTHQNIFSIGNTLYVNTDGGPSAYDLCSGTLLGQLCLNGASLNLWGLSYNETTQMVYATQRYVSKKVWAFTRAQLEAGIAGASCLDPIITLGPNAVVNPGENFLPNIPNSEVFGITSDNAGNMYVVVLVDRNGSAASYLYKYNAAGNFVSSVAFGLVGRAAIGIVWSETTNRLYTSHLTDNPAVNCISAYDASTLDYLGTAAPNPDLASNNFAKAIAILKECCPKNLPSTFQREVCGAIGTKFYLNQEAFNLCDGTVCGSSWTPTDNNNSIMTFDPCDNSVVVNGNGCRTFTLNIGAVSSTGCGAQNSTFTICNTVIDANVNAVVGTCAASGPNNNASIVINNILNVNQAGISVGTVYNGPAYGAAGTISITGGGTFPNLVHNTYYTVRIFNGSNDCFFDRVILTPTLQCCNIAAIVPQNLVCLDNGTPNKTTDNRIRFSAQVTNTNGLLTGYNVSINGGTTITPNTNVPYGVTQFLLGPGTAGGGATFTVTVTDSATPGCTQTFQVVDPGNCTPSTPSCPPIKCGTAAIQINGN